VLTLRSQEGLGEVDGCGDTRGEINGGGSDTSEGEMMTYNGGGW
jgi:hypothetical protein